MSGESDKDLELSSPEETEKTSENAESNDEIDVFHCPVCLEHFKNPKFLPCQHTFCESCIHTYIQSSQIEYKGDGPLKSFLCPLCRQTVESPEPDSRPSEWAALLPTNQMVLSQIKNASETPDESERLCDPCKRDNESSPGVFWCPNCSECLCEMCKKFHRRMKGFEMHKVVTIGNMDTLPKKMTTIDEPCLEHENEVVKVYCNCHRKMCCVMCLAVNHRECKDIKTIQEMAENMMQNNEDKNFIERLKELNINTGKVSNCKQENVDYLEKRHYDLTGEIENLVDKAKANLDNFRERFKTKFCALHKQQHMKLLETKDRVDCFQNTLHNGERMLQAVAENGSNLQFFISVEKLKVRLGAQLLELKFGSEDDNKIDYDLHIDDILSQVAKDSIYTDVYPQFKSCDHGILPVVETVHNMGLQEEHLNPLINADIAYVEPVLRWNSEGDGWFIDGAFLTSGILILIDHINKKLQAFDNYGKELCSLALKDRPLRLAVNKENEIIVTAFEKTSLDTYAFNNNVFSRMHTIEIGTLVKEIAVIENKIIITTEKSLDILTTFGSKLHSIPLANSIDRDFHFIATSKSNFFCILEKSLFIQTLDGHTLKKLALPESLENPCGLALDLNENIYICDRASCSVCLLSKDCEYSCIILKMEQRPFAIGFDNSGKRFFVTFFPQSDSQSTSSGVGVYDLQLKRERCGERQ